MELLPPLAMLAVLAAMLVLFALERYPPDVVAVGGLAVLLATGLLDTDDMLSVFSNSAPLTIGALFVLTGALVRTGCLTRVTRILQGGAVRHPGATLALLLGLTMASSAFMNNTPVVMVMIPVVIAVANDINRPASRFLIPLSYAAILGGTCTLIGTSTNILTDGIAQTRGLAPFHMFEITILGVLISAVGSIYLVVMGPRFLPDRTSLASVLGQNVRQRFLTDVLIAKDSPLVGQALKDIDLFRSRDITVVDVIRRQQSMRPELDSLTLQARDCLVLESTVAEVLSLKEEDAVDLGPPSGLSPVVERPAIVVEALVAPRSRIIGRPLRQHRLRRRYGVYALAVHRHGENLGARVADISLEPGDTVLIEGTSEDIKRLSDDMELVNLSEPTERPYRRNKAPIAAAILFAVVVLAALNVMPIAGLAAIGVAVVLFTRCLDADEAFSVIDWRILVLILSMLGIGKALETTGAAALVVGGIGSHVAGMPPIVTLMVVYVITSVMTETVTNNAVAIIMTPVAIGLAEQLGFEARPFVVAVMFAASASFSTPIGYQTNTLVYGPGGYRFTDFVRIGVPMNLLIGLTVVLTVPFIWPLTK